MNNNSEHLDTLTDIRSLMERSSRFISLSGLSGVFAGIFALIGAGAAYKHLDISLSASNYLHYAQISDSDNYMSTITFLILDASMVLIASLLVSIFLTVRKAKKKDQSIWDSSAKRLLINLLIPLITGGIFCLALLKYSMIGFVAPATLIFYGLALINASKYTLHDIGYLGVCEIIIGLTSMFYLGYGIIFWTIGFGILHIVYGIVMYVKYEK